MTMPPALIWYRRDLRLGDHPALRAALVKNLTPVPVYIHDNSGAWPLGAASAWWLHHSLASLRQNLREIGSELLILRGSAERILPALAKKLGARHVFWNRLYEPAEIKREQSVVSILNQLGIETAGYPGALLAEPGGLTKNDGAPYRVFTPFWRTLQKSFPPGPVLPPPDQLPRPADTGEKNLSIGELALLPEVAWDRGFYDRWEPGESGAWSRLGSFGDEALGSYPQKRDRPDIDGTSRLSPHLHFGETSPRQLWHRIQTWIDTAPTGGKVAAAEGFLRQIAWREFAHHLLYHFPDTAEQPLDPRFGDFPWREDCASDLDAWQHGRTGIPIVDAGMRELWTTGWMHNRVRMIVASLLTKNLLIPWQQGARWFWDTLVDADLANNTLGWQWTAGCGADAAPYFRIFNPVRQGVRFDPEGRYVRRWVPELARLPGRWIHEPWNAPGSVLRDAGVVLDRDYPTPIVDLAASRRRALAAWDRIKKKI